MYSLDNSEWMRNGDYLPSRVDAQNDAVNILCSAKTQQNPENTVGLMSMAGKGHNVPEVMITLTPDVGRLLGALTQLKLKGQSNLVASLQVAQLALKHRQNKNQRQRIIVFSGSPIPASEADLVKLAKKLKKNNIAVDFVDFGEDAENTKKIEAFVNAVNSGDNSHVVTIPPSDNTMLSDVLYSTPIVMGEDAAAGGGGAVPVMSTGGGGGGFEFGVDPSVDPELALALRMSMEEERARQEAAAKAKAEEEAGASAGGDKMDTEGGAAPDAAAAPAATTTTAAAAAAPATGQANAPMADFVDDDDAALKAALALSMGADPNEVNYQGAQAQSAEDAELALALEMSKAEASTASKPDTEMKDAAAPPAASGGDDANLQSVLAGLPGVDPNDPQIQALLQQMQGGDKKEEEKKE
eukprot:TRINITY_DN3241_c0_g1_i1.p1 TRINITY_DN3241_c0_g1~~TRINITY_DN3241_c0_g1_i1.p1  ORF type:complete len:412 (+),score=172.77 TRINITY_DN3241_c0_g1_i1:182-1417(+)